MRILGIIPYRFLPVRIGGQKAAEQLYRTLAKRVPVDVVSTINNDQTEAKGFTLFPIFSNRFIRYGNPFYLKQLSTLICERNTTHIFIEHPYLGWMGVFLKKKHRIPLVIRSQNIESIRFKSIGKWWWRLLWRYEKYIYNAADFLFLITEEDRQYAIEKYKVQNEKAFVASYGTEVAKSPSIVERRNAKEKVCNDLKIGYERILLLFNGSFDYQPNASALEILLKTVLPQLNLRSFPFTLLICGRHIPLPLKNDRWKNVLFLDYVEDIFLYNLAADMFVNPVIEGGGIKTKLVEALAAGANAVSTKSGAFGVNPAWCNGKLIVTDDNDWQAFAESICEMAESKSETNELFYQHFNIEKIAESVIQTIL